MNLRATRNISGSLIAPTMTFRTVMQQPNNRNLRSLVLAWIDKNGPFVEDDRCEEVDDYFEYAGLEVTDTGLGEAARRVKNDDKASTFSFRGGDVDFSKSPLLVDHGLPEDRYGTYKVENFWTVEELANSALNCGQSANSWPALVVAARERFPRCWIPDTIHQNSFLAREPFNAVIRDRVFNLLGYLDAYMQGRHQDGSEDAHARFIIDKFFVGERALFTGESPTNQRKFEAELTFPDPEFPGRTIFAHWHGKISHRYFRMHFEWPVPTSARKIKILYLGPKLTKD